MRFVRFGSIQSRKWTINYWCRYWQMRYNSKTKKTKTVKRIFFWWFPRIRIIEWWDYNFWIILNWLNFEIRLQRYYWNTDNPRLRHLR